MGFGVSFSASDRSIVVSTPIAMQEEPLKEHLLLEIEKLRQELESVKRDNADLEILLQMTTEHSDTVEAELYDRAQAADRESQARLAQFLDAVPVGIFVLDASGQPDYTNRMAQQILGQEVTPATIEQLAIYQVYLNSSDRYPASELPGTLLRGDATVSTLDLQLGDRLVPLEVWGTPIFDEIGNIAYTIVAFQDITERQKSEVEQESFTQQLFQLNKAYERFVPRQFLQLLDKESILDVELGDHVQKEMSVLFADIRNFTPMSENITPEENFKFINSYLSRMEPVILDRNGFIDKFIGDAIMALFSGGADDAVKAGISMLNQLVLYNKDRKKSGYNPIEIGIGINTGSLMLGTVGGQNRMEGTVISDTVNLAARIEELTKEYQVPLLISHQTFSQLQHSEEYLIRIVDRVTIRGKSKQVAVFEVFDAAPPRQREGKLRTKSIFEEALFLYNRGNFIKATQYFQDCLRVNPEDTVAQIYINRCQNNL